MSRRERQLKAINDFWHNNPRATPAQVEAETTASREQRAATERAEWERRQSLAGQVPHDRAFQRRA